MYTFKSNKLSLTGQFTHIKTDGEAYLIGGSARAEMFLHVSKKTVSPNDRDFTVIGGTYVSRDRKPRKEVRVEVDYEDQISLDSYFDSRDFTFNQVAVDRKGKVYATDKAVLAYKKGIIEAVVNHPSLREGARAIRFANEFGWILSPSLKRFIYDNILLIREEVVFKRYLRDGFDMEFNMSP